MDGAARDALQLRRKPDMKVQEWLAVGALIALPTLATAQTTTGATTGTTTTTTTTAQTTTFDDLDSDNGGWFASAFVGSDFGERAEGNSMDFGGALGYSNGWVGAELLAGFTPNFQLRNNILVEDPQVNSYMFNLMGSVPLGSERRWQPFVSGGLGAITLRSDLLSGDDDAFDETLDPDDSQVGGNVGFGIMGFAGGVGIRADVRYFRAFTDAAVEDALNLDPGTIDPNSTPAGQTASAMLSGLDFWRANIGLAFRW
jgi:hypothetical protein